MRITFMRAFNFQSFIFDVTLRIQNISEKYMQQNKFTA